MAKISRQPSLLLLFPLLLAQVIRIASEDNSDDDDRVWKPVNYCEAKPSHTWCESVSKKELSESPVDHPAWCQPNDIRVLLITNFSMTWSASACPNVIYRVEGYIRNKSPDGSTVARTKVCIETDFTTLLLSDISPEKYEPAQLVEFDVVLHARVNDGRRYHGSIKYRYPGVRVVVNIRTGSGSICPWSVRAFTDKDQAETGWRIKRMNYAACYSADEQAAVFREMTEYDKDALNATKEVYQALQNLNTSAQDSEWADMRGKVYIDTTVRLSSVREMYRLLLGHLKVPSQNNTMEKQFGQETPNNAKSFDARTKWSNCKSISKPSIDQAGCGSCAAMAATAAFTDRYCIVHGINPVFSPLNAHVCADQAHDSTELPRNTCFGLRLHPLKYQYFVNHGVPTEECQPWPFKSNCGSPCSPLNFFINVAPSCSDMCWNQTKATFYKGDSTYAVSRLHRHSSEDDLATANANIRREIARRGPVTAGFSVFQDFLHHKSGVYKHDKRSPLLYGHVVRLIGWGEEDNVPFWWVANSWGENWGEGGFFRILRGENECGIERAVDAIAVGGNSGQS